MENIGKTRPSSSCSVNAGGREGYVGKRISTLTTLISAKYFTPLALVNIKFGLLNFYNTEVLM